MPIRPRAHSPTTPTLTFRQSDAGDLNRRAVVRRHAAGAAGPGKLGKIFCL